jgi:integrase
VIDLAPFDYPNGRNPAEVVLARYREGDSRSTAAVALGTLAEIASEGKILARCFPWHRLRYEDTSAIRLELAARFEPRGVNLRLSVLRAVLRVAWRLEYMTAEERDRALDFRNVGGSGRLRGRALGRGEIAAIFEACERDHSPAGPRDASLLGLLYAAGLRASEVTALDLADWNRETGVLEVAGKGGRHRRAWIGPGLAAALEEWLEIRGTSPGPLLYSVARYGLVVPRRLTRQAAQWVCRKRGGAMRLEPFSPHDLRRSFVSHLLDAGADLGTVRALAGHADVSTTVAYDRRGDPARRAASERIVLPYRPRGARRD